MQGFKCANVVRRTPAHRIAACTVSTSSDTEIAGILLAKVDRYRSNEGVFCVLVIRVNRALSTVRGLSLV